MKTSRLRAKFKHYLEPIDPQRPLGYDWTELTMLPVEWATHTCFKTQTKFLRGEKLFRRLERRLGIRGTLERLEAQRLQSPLHCPCETVSQGVDPNRTINRKIPESFPPCGGPSGNYEELEPMEFDNENPNNFEAMGHSQQMNGLNQGIQDMSINYDEAQWRY